MQTKSNIAARLNVDIPLIQAPMAGACLPELAASVSNAGGLGSFGGGYLHPDALREAIRKIRQLTNKPFNINLFVPETVAVTLEAIDDARKAISMACPELKMQIEPPKPPFQPNFAEQMQVLLDENVPVFSFTFGIPDSKWLTRFKAQGIILIGTATHLTEAQKLADAHVDMIVAQGLEAGGHRGTFVGSVEDALIPTFTLTRTLVQKINLPIISAGGMMNAKDITLCMQTGASGAQLGTAFLTCPEAGLPTCYLEKILLSKEDNTVLTRAFSGKFARGIKNLFIERMEKFKNTVLPYPIQNALTRPMRNKAFQQNNANFMSLWAGQKLYLCQQLPVQKLINELRVAFDNEKIL